MGMVTMYRCMWLVGVVVRRCIDIFPTPLVLALFLAAASLLLFSFLKCFFGLLYIYSVKDFNYNVRKFFLSP